MAEYIQNGSFSSGFDNWNNGVGGSPYTLDSGKAKASSNTGNKTEKDFRMQQTFSVNDEIVSAKLSAWGQWDNEDSDTDGHTKFRIQIQKPDSNWFSPLSLTTKDGISSGQLLTDQDITSEMNQQGDYKIQLQCLVASAEDLEAVTNNYNTWDNTNFTIYDSNSKIKRLSGAGDTLEYTAVMFRIFEVDFPATTATLTVRGKGKVTTGVSNPGYARLKVMFRKYGQSWNTLYNDTLENDTWYNIINGLDISSYITSAGIYQIQLEAYVKSSFEASPPTYYVSEVHFGNVDLEVACYDQSFGWYDNISLDIAVKKKKMILDAMTSQETLVYPETLKPSVLNGINIGESIFVYIGDEYIINLADIVNIGEVVDSLAYFEPININISDGISISDAIASFLRIAYYLPVESIGLSEILQAKKISGNVETTYLITDLTSWQEKTAITTQWRKEKTEV